MTKRKKNGVSYVESRKCRQLSEFDEEELEGDDKNV